MLPICKAEARKKTLLFELIELQGAKHNKEFADILCGQGAKMSFAFIETDMLVGPKMVCCSAASIDDEFALHVLLRNACFLVV